MSNKKSNRVETKEFGLDVIWRHDYDHLKHEISKYVEKSCEYFKEFITNIPKNHKLKTFLDIGCSDLQTVKYFEKLGYEAEGLDLHPIVKDERILQHDFYKLTELNRKWDLIMCNHTLEHSLAPLLLEQITKCQTIGGGIFIAVPDADYSWAYDITSSTTHWSIFNAGFLRHMLTRYGYECHVEKKCFREGAGELFLVGIKRFDI